jgi:cytochrome c-type biogenesis protein CcmH/NrfG
LYPQNANAFDSLAEAQMLSGDTVNAIANYKRSLKLSPDNDNAKKMIEKMQSGA